MALTNIGRLSIIAGIALLLAGCEEGGQSNLFKPRDADSETASGPRGTARGGQREVEAPKVFQVTDEGLWDGRPSLGGIWVAHTSVKDPQKVIIRNQVNGKSVTGALFRRERENPGPSFQVSSDASEALGMLAGQPAKLEVTALIREELPEPAAKPQPVVEEAPEAAQTPVKTAELLGETAAPASKPSSASETIEQTTLDPIAAAAAAIEAADGGGEVPATTPVRTAKPLFALTKPFVQLAAFDTEETATAAADTLRKAGLSPEVKEQNSGEISVWRVVIGPAASRKERNALKKQVIGLGFAKVIFVKE